MNIPHRSFPSRINIVRIRRWWAALSIVAIGVVIGAPPASAHAQLVKSSPIAGIDLPSSPTEVVLTFSEAVEVAPGAIRVFGEQGERVDAGAVSQPESNLARIGLDDLPKGGYVVAWRVLSADGHPAQGAFTFQVLNGSAISEARARALAQQDDDLTFPNIASGIGRAAAILAMLFLGAWMVTQSLGGAPSRRWVLPLGVVFGVISAIGLLVGAASAISGTGSEALTDVDALRAALETRPIGAAVLRGMIPLLLALWVKGLPRPRPSLWVRGALAIAVMAVASSNIGHSAVGRYSTIAMATVTLHWGMIALWCGGLFALSLAWGRWSDEERVAATSALSPVFLVSVGLIVATGAFQTWRLLPDLTALGTERFGQMISVKVILLAVIVVIAAGNRGALVDLRDGLHGQEEPDQAADETSGLGSGANTERSSRLLRRGMIGELVVVVGIIAATVVLGGSSPNATKEEVRGASYTESTSDGTYEVTLDITSLRTGPAELHITVSGKNGTIPPAQQISVSLRQPAKQIENFDQRLLILGPGHVQTVGTQFNAGGVWNVLVTIQTTEFSASTAVIPVDIP